MSLFVIPCKVSLRLKKLQRAKRRPHLVNWLIVVLDKKGGGLGVRMFFALNKALLEKRCWRFAFEYEPL